MNDPSGFASKMEALLGEWEDKIAVMQSKETAIHPEKREAYKNYVASMIARHKEAAMTLDSLHQGTMAEPLARSSLELGWKQMTQAYEKALCQFEGVHN